MRSFLLLVTGESAIGWRTELYLSQALVCDFIIKVDGLEEMAAALLCGIYASSPVVYTNLAPLCLRVRVELI